MKPHRVTDRSKPLQLSGNKVTIPLKQEITKKQIHGAHARGPLEIKGYFHAQGPQPVDDNSGAPQWVADLMDRYPDVKQVAISSDSHSTVWSRIFGN